MDRQISPSPSDKKGPQNLIEDEANRSPEAQIMVHIFENDPSALKKWKVGQRNINYLTEFSEVNLESRLSPLILGCYLGRLDCVKMILDNPFVDVDFASEDSGFTPLCIACLTGNYEIVKLLVDADAEVNKPTKFNETPMKLCFNRLNEETNLFENKKICFKMAELLLDHGADINWIVDKTKGHNLLMKFCCVKMDLSPREAQVNLEVIRFLVEHGADKNMKAIKNKTAFDMAAKHSNKDNVQELLKALSHLYSHSSQKKRLRVTIDKKKAQSALDTSKYDKSGTK